MARADFHVATYQGSSTNEVLAQPHSDDAADGFGPRTLPEVRGKVRLGPCVGSVGKTGTRSWGAIMGYMDACSFMARASKITPTADAPPAGVRTIMPACGELFSRLPGLPASAR